MHDCDYYEYDTFAPDTQARSTTSAHGSRAGTACPSWFVMQFCNDRVGLSCSHAWERETSFIAKQFGVASVLPRCHAFFQRKEQQHNHINSLTVCPPRGRPACVRCKSPITMKNAPTPNKLGSICIANLSKWNTRPHASICITDLPSRIAKICIAKDPSKSGACHASDPIYA